MFHIEDWTGQRRFPDQTFKTFLDGWDFLMRQFPDDPEGDDGNLQEFYVERTDA